MRPSLRHQIVISLVVLSGVITVVSVWSTVRLVSHNMRDEILRRGQSTVAAYTEPVSDLVLAGDRAKLTGLIVGESLRNEDISYIVVFDSQHRILAHTFFSEIPESIITHRHTLTSDGVPMTVIVELPDGSKVYDIEHELMHQKGYLNVGFNKSFIDSSVARIDRSVVFLMLLVGALTFFISWKMTDGLIKPLRHLKEKAHALGDGDFDARIDDVTEDEIGELAATFNTMAEQLSRITIKRDYFDNIIANIAALLIVLDPKGRILFVNSAVELDLGFADDELIGQSIGALLSEELRGGTPLKAEELVKLVRLGAVLDYDTCFVAKGGHCIPVILSGSVLTDKFGRPGNLILVAKNVTERKKAEAVLEKTNADLRKNERALKHMMFDMKNTYDELKNTHAQLMQSEKLASLGQLSAGVAHEINNPLGYISNNIAVIAEYIAAYQDVTESATQLRSAIEREDWEAAKQKGQALKELEDQLNLAYIREDCEKVVRETISGTERIKRIVQDLKTFARKDEGQMELHSIEDVIEGVINIVWNEIKYRAELKKDYADLPLIRCNPQKLGQVFIALLVNASQAIKDKGEITIRTYVDAPYACIDISDTGCGIDETHLEHIFEPFFTTKPVGVGTGLGLSVSHEIITGHGGKLVVKSVPGQGTTFTIRLPLNESVLKRQHKGAAA